MSININYCGVMDHCRMEQNSQQPKFHNDYQQNNDILSLSYPVGYLLIWQHRNFQGALDPNLFTTLPLLPLGLKAQNWPSYFLDPLDGSADLPISTSKCHFKLNIFVCTTDV
jgi:hypothetical protein